MGVAALSNLRQFEQKQQFTVNSVIHNVKVLSKGLDNVSHLQRLFVCLQRYKVTFRSTKGHCTELPPSLAVVCFDAKILDKSRSALHYFKVHPLLASSIEITLFFYLVILDIVLKLFQLYTFTKSICFDHFVSLARTRA